MANEVVTGPEIEMGTSERQILERLVVGNDDLERLESRLDEFNAFEAIGAVRSEIRHSDFLSYLLDPNANHRLGDALVKAFLKRALLNSEVDGVSAIEVDVNSYADAEIRREWRNIDILILSELNNHVIAIENKVDSSEHSGQLERYADIIDSEFSGYRKTLLFLTPSGSPPSDYRWIPSSYSDVVETIDRVTGSHASTIGEDVKMLCDHYSTMVRRHIVTESETAELCRQLYRRHKKAFDLIFEHRPDLQADLSEILRNQIENQPDELELDHCTKSYIRFAVRDWDKSSSQLTGSGWTRTKRVVLFEINNFEDRMVLKLVVGPGDQSFRERVWDCAQRNRTALPGGVTKLYPKWTQLFTFRFLGKKDYENPEDQNYEEKIKHRWEKFLESSYPEIRRIFDPIFS